jgi:hypothetical protein
MEEGAVKPLVGHSYVYRLDLVGEDGDIKSVTTDDCGYRHSEVHFGR